MHARVMTTQQKVCFMLQNILTKNCLLQEDDDSLLTCKQPSTIFTGCSGVRLSKIDYTTIIAAAVVYNIYQAIGEWINCVYSLWTSRTFSMEWMALGFGLCCSTSSGRGFNWKEDQKSRLNLDAWRLSFF